VSIQRLDCLDRRLRIQASLLASDITTSPHKQPCLPREAADATCLRLTGSGAAFSPQLTVKFVTVLVEYGTVPFALHVTPSSCEEFVQQ